MLIVFGIPQVECGATNSVRPTRATMQLLPTRILIIEDNRDDETLLLRQLKKAKLHQQIRLIADGGVALDYLTDAKSESERLVAIFLDLKLPTVSGLQLWESIRSTERIRHLPVILMTSSSSPQDMGKCRLLGVSACVTKPVSFSAFTKAVTRGGLSSPIGRSCSRSWKNWAARSIIKTSRPTFNAARIKSIGCRATIKFGPSWAKNRIVKER